MVTRNLGNLKSLRFADGRKRKKEMAKKTFELTARVSTDNLKAIQPVLDEVLPKGSITKSDDGFLIKAKMTGESARELIEPCISSGLAAGAICPHVE